MTPTSRAVAARVVSDVDAGEFAEVALRRRLAASGLTGGPAGRTTALAYGTLRLRGRCDFVLAQFIDRRLEQVEPLALAVLRVACFELLWTESDEVAKVVDGAVRASKEVGLPRAAGFINGVLRNLSQNRDDWRHCPRQLRGLDRLVHWGSHPRWLVRRWWQRFGPEAAAELVRAGNREPGIHLRVNLARTSREELLERLRAAGVTAAPSELSPVGLRLAAAGRIEELPGYAEGWFSVQDEAAQLVAPLLEPRAGETVLDLCAAPGGKTCHLAELTGDAAPILAVDVQPERLRSVTESAARLGLASVTVRVADGRLLPGRVPPAERVLLDAPCSGTGTLARRPDLRWRLTDRRLVEVLALQRELLVAAARLTAPGGVMVYATCSLETEENEEQMRRFDAEQPDFRPDTPAIPPPGWDAERGWTTLPAAGHDGFFLARRRRRS